uniref:Uncharacterized protein n=1 Tax=Amphimedon queenslandica TaxID=400682 RepID=A0A1X7UYX1_AMPQE
MEWEHGSVDNNIDDILRKIRPYYDFIDCQLLLEMSKKFLPSVTFTDGGVTYKLVDELDSHNRISKRLCTSETVSTLQKLLEERYEPFNRKMDNLPYIEIHLQTPWNYISIQRLYKLIAKLLPLKYSQLEYKQSIIEHITIRSKCVVIKLHILDFTADSLIECTGGKLQFMRLIGIFSLYINDHPVLQEDENMNFTFELALLEAVTAGNNEAVEFLLQLETDNKGWTALMIASKYNHISIIHMLLQANANPHLKTSDGSKVDTNVRNKDGATALMIASASGHHKVVQLLLEWEADPTIESNDGNTALSLSETSEIYALINNYMHKKGNIKLEEDAASTAPDNSSTRSSPVSPETEFIRCRTASDVSSTRSLSTSDSERMESTRPQEATDTRSSSESERVESSGYDSAKEKLKATKSDTLTCASQSVIGVSRIPFNIEGKFSFLTSEVYSFTTDNRSETVLLDPNI